MQTPDTAGAAAGRDFGRSAEMFRAACEVIPGGVTSAVRSGARPHPLYFDRGLGPRLWDADGNEYVDFALGYGPLILGHSPEVVRRALHAQIDRALTFGSQHRLEIEVARLLVEVVPGAGQAIFSNTGSEAVSAALHIARAATGRTKVLKFEGHYHGWLDGVAASTSFDPERSGDDRRPATVPASGGLSQAALSDIVVAPWNDLDAVEALVASHRDELAAILLEPCLVNGGVIPPQPGFLEGLRSVSTAAGALLVFDEVITGFRLGLGGAQEFYGVGADLAIFGKALAGGAPLSAVTGSRELLAVVADGRVTHNGTFNANPIATAAAAATLRHLRDNASEIYPRLAALGRTLADGLRAASPRLRVREVGPIVHTAIDEPERVLSVRDRRTGRPDIHARFAERLLHHGVHATPRGLWYVSTAHGPAEIEGAARAAAAAAAETLGAPPADA